MNEIRWHVHSDTEDMARAAAAYILDAARKALEERGVFRIVLAGGNTPRAVYELLKEADTDWEKWHIYYGDERCLPAEHEARNSVMAQKAWLAHVPLPPRQHHTIPAELGAHPAAQVYRSLLASVPRFHLVLLGMGEDGHTASLFPGRKHPAEESVHAVFNAPKPPSERVTLSTLRLSATEKVLFILSGADKHSALCTWREGGNLPVSGIQAYEGVDVMLDEAAWRKDLQ